MTAPKVTVRMYQGLLGDCFLIRLFDAAAPDRSAPAAANILVDCGILQNVTDEQARIERVVADIVEVTGGRLDLLVATHEHYDHVSGFGYGRRQFIDEGGLEIGALWLAWTEKDGDPQAERLRAAFDRSRQAVRAGLAWAKTFAAADQAFTLPGDAAGLEAFIGPDTSELGVRGGGMTVAEIMAGLKRRLQPPPENFLEPGEARRTPGALGLRAFVLGPPRDERLLFKDRPSSSTEHKETYLKAVEIEADVLARKYEPGDDHETDDPDLRSMPFGTRYQRLREHAVLRGKLTEPAADAPADVRNLWSVRQKYLDPANGWQNLALDEVSQFALKLDSDTNNTSLVLAFELEPGGDVLLFAADAQVGNWLSWHEQDYPADDADPTRRVTAAELLARTTLYKVGHHGSHNATLAGKGLEMMTSGRLTALIPVMEEVAQQRRWKMPFEPLYEALLRHTQGRILRGDRARPDADVLRADPDFARRVRPDPNPDQALGPAWIEYDVA